MHGIDNCFFPMSFSRSLFSSFSSSFSTTTTTTIFSYFLLLLLFLPILFFPALLIKSVFVVFSAEFFMNMEFPRNFLSLRIQFTPHLCISRCICTHVWYISIQRGEQHFSSASYQMHEYQILFGDLKKKMHGNTYTHTRTHTACIVLKHRLRGNCFIGDTFLCHFRQFSFRVIALSHIPLTRYYALQFLVASTKCPEKPK